METQFTPPLRLILTHLCNGNCVFCHKEGFGEKGTMDWTTICDCSSVAEELGIPSISLTGGEPTIRKDLATIINGLQNRYSGHVCLTTNGYALSNLHNKINRPLHTVNLSMISFNKDLWEKYQNVAPQKALSDIQLLSALNKNLNIVITDDNYREINDTISCCIDNSISLDIMFELKRYNKSDIAIQQFVLYSFLKLGTPIIQYGPTPSLTINVGNACKISIKHPVLTSLVRWDVCHGCKQISSCFERICAIRVYPNGIVTPCLNHEIVANGECIKDKIQNTYQLLGQIKITYVELSELIVNSGFNFNLMKI